MFGYTPAGPTYLGEVRRDARLELIARSPSEAGAREAMKRWIAEPMSLRAREAVLACAVAYPEPVESRFGEVAAEGRAKFFEDARTTLTGDAASALIVRVAQRSGMVDEGIAALKGRQDAVAVQSLLDVARGTGTIETRRSRCRGA